MRSSQRRARQRPRRRCVCCCCSHCLRLCHFFVKLICCLPRTCSNACNNGNLPTSARPPFFRCASCSRDNDNNLLSYLSLSLPLSVSQTVSRYEWHKSEFWELAKWHKGCLSVCLSACELTRCCLPWRQSGRCWKYAAVSKNLLEAVAVAAKVHQSQQQQQQQQWLQLQLLWQWGFWVTGLSWVYSMQKTSQVETLLKGWVKYNI